MRVQYFFLWILTSISSFGTEIPKDTSFTVNSAFIKEKHKFPFIQIAESVQSDQLIHKKDLVYFSLGQRDLHLDLMYPKTEDTCRFPGVVLIHGGGWRSGSRSHLLPMATELASHGYAAAVVEYRLSPEALYPASIYDIKQAIRWLRSQYTLYPVDTSRIAILGCSSGAQIATLIGCTNGNSHFDKHESMFRFSSAVQAIVNVDGIVDFTCREALKYENDPRKNPSAAGAWFGGNYETKGELWKEASPVYYVTVQTPPILFVNSAIARFHAGRDAMIQKMSVFGIYSEVHTLPDTPHPFWLFTPWFDETADIVVGYLEKVF